MAKQALCVKLGLVGIVTLVLVAMLQPTRVNSYDESVMLLGAMQVEQGNFPGSGFYSVYGPLQYVVSAGLLMLFDDNVLAVRLYHAITVTVTLLALAGTVLIRTTAASIAAVGLYVLIGIYAFSDLAFPLYPTHMLALFGAIYTCAMARCTNASATQAIIGNAIFIALLVLLVPLQGAIISAMLFIAVPFQQLNVNSLNWKSTVNAYARLLTAAGAACLALLAYENATGGSLWATTQFLLFEQIPAYASHRNLPVPTLSTSTKDFAYFYFPLIMLPLGGSYYLYTLLSRNEVSPQIRTRIFWLLFFGTILFGVGLVRKDAPHFLPANLFSWAALFMLVDQSLGRIQGRALPFGIAILATSIWLNYLRDRLPQDDTFATDCELELLTRSPMSCLRVGNSAQWKRRQDEISTLDKFLVPNEKIFVTTRHLDKLYVADLSYYFLLGRLPWTRWAHLEPGIQTTETVQRDIIGELNEQIDLNGRAVVIIQPSVESAENNLSAVSSGVTLLDDYLAHCELSLDFGDVYVRSCKRSGLTE